MERITASVESYLHQVQTSYLNISMLWWKMILNRKCWLNNFPVSDGYEVCWIILLWKLCKWDAHCICIVVCALLIQANEGRFPLFVNNCLPTLTVYRPNYICHTNSRSSFMFFIFLKKNLNEKLVALKRLIFKQYSNIFANDFRDNILYYSTSYIINVAVINCDIWVHRVIVLTVWKQ